MLPVKTALLVAAALAVAILPALGQVGPTLTQLTGDLGTLDLTTTVTLSAGVYHYQYDLYFKAKAPNGGNVHSFSVDNLAQSAYTNAQNTDLPPFLNPAYNPADVSIDWLSGQMLVGDTVTFSYDSVYAPDPVNVYALAVNGGTSATGLTWGMGSEIPEPGSLVALSGMLACAAGLFRRRR